MSEDQDEKVETSEEGTVIIKMKAFNNILTHALEYGNIYSDYKTQAMGFCIGKVNAEKKMLEVVNAIPITHGDHIEIGFSEKDHAALLNIQKLHPGQVIGYYHSHPGFDIFFSKADKANNLYFQNTQNPFGFGIVIDPSKIKINKSFGLDIFRLKDFKLGVESDYVRVKHEIEYPNSLEYFKWIQKLVEDSQIKTPILTSEQTEAKEHDRFELQEIPGSKEDVEGEISFEKRKVGPVISGLMEGTKVFSESFVDTYRSELATWERAFNQGTIQSTKKIQDSLKQMGLTISDGLGKVENFFDKVFKTRINEFNNELHSLVNQRSEKQEELKNYILKVKETLINDVRDGIEEITTRIHDDLKGNLDSFSSQIDKTMEENETFERNIAKSNELISKITGQVEDNIENINKSIERIIQPFESNILDDYDKILSEIDPLQTNHSEIKDLMEKFQKIISDLRTFKK